MAKALQCPSCGTKKRIDTLLGGDTFECEGCGQVTKVPPGLQDDHRAAPDSRRKADPVAAAVTSRADTPPAPPKRRSAAAAAGVVATGTAAMSVPAPPVADAGGGGVAVGAPPMRGSAGRRSASILSDAPGDESRPIKVYWRVLAWLVALPIALAAVGIPARGAGYLNSQRLLDVIAHNNLTRFVPILVIVVLWALMTAFLVTAILAVGQRLAARRRQRRHG